MSALDDALTQAEIAPYSDMDISPAKKELAQLRADLQAAQERSANQARQLDAARKVIMAWHIVELNECGEDIFPLMKQLDEIDLYESGDDLLLWAQELRRVWLAANPVTQTDDQDAADRFNDWRKEREEDFSRRIEAAS